VTTSSPGSANSPSRPTPASPSPPTPTSGGFGIARCLDAGADIVVTGRVTDASVIVGPAISHFGWTRADLDAMAGATAAGHVIECGTQATGGNYSFFNRGEISDPVTPGFPIAEIFADGTSVITKHAGTGGAVTVGTVTSQLLYEVTGARYGGPDVVTRLDTAVVEQEGPDRVRISGVRGETAPTTTKVSVTCLAGFRNELTFLLTGLDIEDKAALVERQFLAGLATRPAEIDFRLQRTDHPDADTQAARHRDAHHRGVGPGQGRGGPGVLRRRRGHDAVQLPGCHAQRASGPRRSVRRLHPRLPGPGGDPARRGAARRDPGGHRAPGDHGGDGGRARLRRPRRRRRTAARVRAVERVQHPAPVG
jgi:hypothetical protein